MFYRTQIRTTYCRRVDIMISSLGNHPRFKAQVARFSYIDGDRDKSPLNGETMIENGGRTGGKTGSDRRWSYRARSIGR